MTVIRSNFYVLTNKDLWRSDNVYSMLIDWVNEKFSMDDFFCARVAACEMEKLNRALK